jgi:hypothetical protein
MAFTFRGRSVLRQVKDDERSVRQRTDRMTEDIDNIRELIHEDRRRTVHELAVTVGISYGVRPEILLVT